jgi:chemotaxis protein CheD
LIVIGHKDGSIEKASAVRFTQKTKGLNTHTVIGGEFAVGSDLEHVAFKTLLGSCVAIMFYDKVKHIKGMNHFLLPTTNNNNDDMKYGLYSVEAMLNEMYKDIWWCRHYATKYRFFYWSKKCRVCKRFL